VNSFYFMNMKFCGLIKVNKMLFHTVYFKLSSFYTGAALLHLCFWTMIKRPCWCGGTVYNVHRVITKQFIALIYDIIMHNVFGPTKLRPIKINLLNCQTLPQPIVFDYLHLIFFFNWMKACCNTLCTLFYN
jgi:hypothetical protein